LLRTVRLEVALLAVVVAVTGMLVNETPARVLATPELVTLSAPLGDGTVEVVVDPATAGRNDVHAYLLGPDGGLDDRYDDAGFELSLPALGVGPLDLEPVRAGPGHFQVVGTDLDLAGQWDLTIRVRPDRFTEQVATLTFEVR
jgi:copper transport protein